VDAEEVDDDDDDVECRARGSLGRGDAGALAPAPAPARGDAGGKYALSLRAGLSSFLAGAAPPRSRSAVRLCERWCRSARGVAGAAHELAPRPGDGGSRCAASASARPREGVRSSPLGVVGAPDEVDDGAAGRVRGRVGVCGTKPCAAEAKRRGRAPAAGTVVLALEGFERFRTRSSRAEAEVEVVDEVVDETSAGSGVLDEGAAASGRR